MTLEKRLEIEFYVLRRYVNIFLNFVQWVAFEKFGMIDFVLTYNRDWAQYGLALNLYFQSFAA